MFANLVLALGLLLTSASQLRIPGAPIGPGELLLTCWLVIRIAEVLLGRELASNRAFVQLSLFWSLFAASLCLGTIVTVATNEAIDAEWFLHDAIAYPLIGVVSCLTVAEHNARAQLDRVAWLLAGLGGILLALLVAGGQGLVPLPFDPWFWERFRGWSQNPNQLSELCGALVFINLHLLDVSRRWYSRVAALLCMAIALYAGVLTQSDTFRYAMLVAIPLFAVLKLRAGLRVSWGASFVLVILTSSLVAFLAIVPSPLPNVGINPTDFAAAFSKQGGEKQSEEAALRESLWGQALHRGLSDSWMLGLGPGPHLMIPPEIVAAHASSAGKNAPANTVHPQADGKANFEAHSTVLDLFTQGGLLAIGILFWLLAAALRRAAAQDRAGLMALLAGFGVFMLTGNIIRTPTLWFGLALCLVAERQAAVQRLSRPRLSPKSYASSNLELPVPARRAVFSRP